MTNEHIPLENEELLTEKECAKRLKVTRETLSRLRRDGGMPWVALGKGPRPRVRYVWSDVERWARSLSRNNPEQPRPRKRGRPRNTERGPDGGSSS